ncbi:hypothetical protein EJV47_22325 [Hymenobacter gummosus]|uniref:Uncharacterized protein n=1 Tax=Hymenobacter gummosus TaxID=1776032 RepID=A0A3S0J6W4_9BACT|nr:hypothetical protein [Hymenobacter gummosus]RTQ46267.1 hypothetical protein EJV47_22325 [Hymenobacter gummosus]
MADFVPPGWQIEQQLRADLGGDSRPDAVLMLIEPERDGADRRRLLVVLLARGTADWQRVGLGPRVLLCSGCFGPLDGAPRVRILNHVLLVQQDGGSRYAIDRTQRFRYEPATGRMRFIGEERDVLDRHSLSNAHYSSNLLTGQQRIDVNVPEKQTITSSRRRAFSLAAWYLESVDNECNAQACLPWLPASHNHYDGLPR